MKCLILAGGKGERLWPLSRKNYPKQFIGIRKDHSVFQETVARNLPFCDEFIIVAGAEHKDIINNQLRKFQGLSYRCIYEEVPRRTTASVLLACLGIEESEYVFAVASDHMIDSSSEEYRDAIIDAKEKAGKGYISVFGKEDKCIDPKYGYICNGIFTEKPRNANELMNGGTVYRNLGMILFMNGTLLNEARNLIPDIYAQCKAGYRKREKRRRSIFYSEDVLNTIEPVSVERSILEKTKLLNMTEAKFPWKELTSLEDLDVSDYEASGLSIKNNSDSSIAINDSSVRALVLNGVDDLIVVNTDDAVYVGRKGVSSDIKQIINDTRKLDNFTDRSNIFYRQWGYYTQLEENTDYHVRRVTVLPGRTIYAHSHDNRTENWVILSGEGLITLGDKKHRNKGPENISIPAGEIHQISNIGQTPLIFIDTTYGHNIHESERLPRTRDQRDLNETDLGVRNESFVRLRPHFKDYLWGGKELKKRFSMDCDLSHVAEAWLMSAHSEGPSLVASGRHKGMLFDDYIETSGKDILGWKCASNEAFPLLVKFIDAKNDLSVQVHPGDDYALQNESQYGKSEMWYVIDSIEGAGLYVGFKKDVTAEEVRSSIEDKTITELMNFFPTRPGDVFYIPAGTVHAIGAGNLICEVQQSSTCTYRLYDFDRKDSFGNRRELHVDKALAVADLKAYVPFELKRSGDLLCRCKYFECSRKIIDGQYRIEVSESEFLSLVFIEGHAVISDTEGNRTEARAGEAVFIPAGRNDLLLSGKAAFLIVHV